MIVHYMVKRVFVAALALSLAARAAVPTPAEHLGYRPGTDYKLADYADVAGYFRKLAASSDRIKVEEFGRSFHGKPMLVAYISSAENLRQLGKWKALNRRMALGEATEEEAGRLAREGKAIVWIDSGLHASEVAPVQHSFDLAYKMVTAEDDETRRIRGNVILLQVPVVNPDGLDWIVHWYRKNVGTPYELAPLPRLYHEYAGHDNNRDWFMMNLAETRHVARIFYQEWFPHIIYNQHQQPEFPARIFVPPYAEPLNPNIPAAVIEGVNIIGSAMRERFARENKPGVLSYQGYDAWWNGGLRTAPKFHNMHGILTETAIGFSGSGTPAEYNPGDFPALFRNGMPTRESGIFYSRPWLGGKWTTRDAIEYMLTADFAILELASARSEYFLKKAWDLARASIDAGKRGGPYAYVLPRDQWDWSAAVDLAKRLQLAGIEVHRAQREFALKGRSIPEGSLVLLAAQPFRPYLIDLLEPQKYPEIKTGQTGPTKPPYDIAGWTLSMNMGVETVRAAEAFEAPLERVKDLSVPAPSTGTNWVSSYRAAASQWKNGGTVQWRGKRLAAPRVAIYESYVPNMDAGWTRYLLDDYGIPAATLHNEDFRKDSWRSKTGVLILASQTAASILHGTRDGEAAQNFRGKSINAKPSLQRPEFTGGIGVQGLSQIGEFVRGGGTLVAFDSAAELSVEHLAVPLRPLVQPGGGFYCPGSIVRISVDQTHPLAAGVPADAYAFVSGGQAWDVSLVKEFNKDEREVKVVARYAEKNLLASGWVSGERTVLGKAALVEARLGKGRVVLFGFRPQFRAQTAGTFKFLFNAIFQSAESN
jgi:hypothetical protein